jgi:hypothetical protein
MKEKQDAAATAPLPGQHQPSAPITKYEGLKLWEGSMEENAERYKKFQDENNPAYLRERVNPYSKRREEEL